MFSLQHLQIIDISTEGGFSTMHHRLHSNNLQVTTFHTVVLFVDTASPHHHNTISPYHHITTSPHHHITSPQHITTSPQHHITTSHHITTTPHHHITSPHHITTSPQQANQLKPSKLNSGCQTFKTFITLNATININLKKRFTTN